MNDMHPAVDFEAAADLPSLYELLDQVQVKNGWAKAVAVMLRAVDAENPPLHLPIGPAAHGVAERKFAAFRADMAAWRDLSFQKLRAEGAYLVSATQTAGKIREIEIQAERDGQVSLFNPWRRAPSVRGGDQAVKTKVKNGIVSWSVRAGRSYRISA